MIYNEPRLVKKMHPTLFMIFKQTSGKSLEYEIIKIVIAHFKDFPDIHELAKQKLNNLLKDNDCNSTFFISSIFGHSSLNVVSLEQSLGSIALLRTFTTIV